LLDRSFQGIRTCTSPMLGPLLVLVGWEYLHPQTRSFSQGKPLRPGQSVCIALHSPTASSTVSNAITFRRRGWTQQCPRPVGTLPYLGNAAFTLRDYPHQEGRARSTGMPEFSHGRRAELVCPATPHSPARAAPRLGSEAIAAGIVQRRLGIWPPEIMVHRAQTCSP
jgi:hypothetical protein